MIKVLGARRVLIFLVLLGANALFAAGLYVYLTPETIKKQRELRQTRSQISSLQADIDRLLVEFDQLEAQQDQFDVLKERGFFSSQSRRQAEKVLDRIQREAGVISAVANIQAGSLEDDAEAQKADHKILISPVNISMAAMDDIDIYRYLYLIERFFPGHVSVQNIHLERKAELTGPILRSIASGDNPELVQAEIELTWETMIPNSEILGDGGGRP